MIFNVKMMLALMMARAAYADDSQYVCGRHSDDNSCYLTHSEDGCFGDGGCTQEDCCVCVQETRDCIADSSCMAIVSAEDVDVAACSANAKCQSMTECNLMSDTMVCGRDSEDNSCYLMYPDGDCLSDGGCTREDCCGCTQEQMDCFGDTACFDIVNVEDGNIDMTACSANAICQRVAECMIASGEDSPFSNGSGNDQSGSNNAQVNLKKTKDDDSSSDDDNTAVIVIVVVSVVVVVLGAVSYLGYRYKGEICGKTTEA